MQEKPSFLFGKQLMKSILKFWGYFVGGVLWVIVIL
jgi:hypothetical protein